MVKTYNYLSIFFIFQFSIVFFKGMPLIAIWAKQNGIDRFPRALPYLIEQKFLGYFKDTFEKKRLLLTKPTAASYCNYPYVVTTYFLPIFYFQLFVHFFFTSNKKEKTCPIGLKQYFLLFSTSKNCYIEIFENVYQFNFGKIS